MSSPVKLRFDAKKIIQGICWELTESLRLKNLEFASFSTQFKRLKKEKVKFEIEREKWASYSAYMRLSQLLHWARCNYKTDDKQITRLVETQ